MTDTGTFSDIFSDIFGGDAGVIGLAGQILTRGLLMGPGTKLQIDDAGMPDGLGSLPPRASVTSRPRQHGSRPVKQYQPERLLRWTLLVLADTPEEAMGLLATVGEAWAPLTDGSMVELQIRLAEDRTYLLIGQPSRTQVDLSELGQSTPSIACEWVALDPRFYDADILFDVTTALGLSTDGLEFPHDFPFGFGDAFGAIGTAHAGNVPVPWEATITGGAGGLVNPAVALGSTGDTLQFIISLNPGQTLILDSRERTVLLEGIADRSNTLNRPTAASWFDIPAGADEVTFTGTGAGTLELQYRSGWNL